MDKNSAELGQTVMQWILRFMAGEMFYQRTTLGDVHAYVPRAATRTGFELNRNGRDGTFFVPWGELFEKYSFEDEQ